MARQELDPVRKHSARRVTHRLDAERHRRLAESVAAPPGEVTARPAGLDKEWDIERVLQAIAATLMLAAVTFMAARPPGRPAARPPGRPAGAPRWRRSSRRSCSSTPCRAGARRSRRSACSAAAAATRSTPAHRPQGSAQRLRRRPSPRRRRRRCGHCGHRGHRGQGGARCGRPPLGRTRPGRRGPGLPRRRGQGRPSIARSRRPRPVAAGAPARPPQVHRCPSGTDAIT